jgi:hypothetical protein
MAESVTWAREARYNEHLHDVIIVDVIIQGKSQAFTHKATLRW